MEKSGLLNFQFYFKLFGKNCHIYPPSWLSSAGEEIWVFGLQQLAAQLETQVHSVTTCFLKGLSPKKPCKNS